MLAGCAATEGPLLRAVGEPAGNGSIAGNSGSSAASGGSAEATAGTGGSIAGSGGTGGSTAGTSGTAGDPRIVRGMSFQYQLVDEVNIDVDAELFVVDLFNAEVEIIDALHAQGKVVVAYVSAGTHEPYRDDADLFPASTVGQPLESYPNESWLDVRAPAVRELMAARLDLARDNGFDGVLPTSLSAHLHDSGFDLTAEDQLDYGLWFAAEVRERGLTPGLADLAQLDRMVDSIDWAMHFGCIARGDCAELSPFIAQGKPVFDLEYEGEIATVCDEAERYGVTAILKNRRLDDYRVACP